MPRVLAAADIGSNTAHILIAEASGNSVTRIENRSEWLSLGEVVGLFGEVPESLTDQMISILKSFKTLATTYDADSMYVFATEAMRAAKNHDRVLAKIKKATGLQIDLISARQEAEFGFRGAKLDTIYEGPILFWELGGGSVQVAYCEEDFLVEEESLPLGTGRLIASALLTQPSHPDQLRLLTEIVRDAVGSLAVQAAPSAVACGGVARGLWRAVHPDGLKTLAIEELDYLIWSTQRLPPGIVSTRFGVKGKRAGTLLPGAVVYRELMTHFGLREMRISEYGVREGAIFEVAAGRVGNCRV